MSMIFGRVFVLEVGDQGETLTIDGFSGNPAQISFRVETFINSPQSLATITVFGLSAESRRKLYERYKQVRLVAGYRESFAQVFNGKIYNVSIGRDGAEVFVTLYARSMGEKWETAYVNQAWGNNTSPKEVITSVAATFGNPVELVGDFDSFPRLMYGETISTGSKEVMRQLARRYDFTWTVDADGTMVVARTGAVRRPDIIRRISADTGMIGSPLIKERGLDVTSTMRVDIRPNDQVEVENATSELGFANLRGARFPDTIGAGLYKAIGVTHSGDFHDGDWTTLVECLSPRTTELVN